MFKVWNTLSRQLENFQPLKDKQVGLYTCGPTVYNPVTLGNWRAFLFDDVLARSLRFFDYHVTHVMNITDVGHLVNDSDDGEDKIEREAARRGVDAWELARSLEGEFVRGLERLNIRLPDKLPRVTEHIAEQIALVRQLEEKGFTYRTTDGVYFDTSKFSAYGRLSRQKLEDKAAGARVTVNSEKKNPSDFALWKFSPDDKRRQMEWDSPWGIGFPGWHIECSAMARKYLGQPFDIHCGGVDHIAVHHENEIAQSEAAYDQPLARYWLHNEFLLVDGRRMGKSEGNAFTLDDLAERGFEPLAYRYFCLGAHYRSKLNFTWDAMSGAQAALKKLHAFCRALPVADADLSVASSDFRAALEDDLNTPQALAALWECVKSDRAAAEKSAALLAMDEVLGLRLADYLGQAITPSDEVRALADERLIARKNKDWKTSDELRQRLEERGWKIEDTPQGYELMPLD